MGFWRSWARFNVQKATLTVPNLLLYALLLRLGAGWLLANLGTTAVFTVANYLIGDIWSFSAGTIQKLAGRAADRAAGDAPAMVIPAMVIPPQRAGPATPAASVVIPCKNSEATIRATVDALLAQDYPALVEVIVVGSTGDSTFRALDGITDARLIMLEQENTPGKRDPNVKRHHGICQSSGEILALADSDIVMDPGWLSAAVRMLQAQHGGLVAGGMRSIHDTFWGRFVDRNVLAAKTPRLPRAYYVTRRNFGHRHCRPPITANAVFTRELYEACPLDTTWAYGYEDYEWFWRLVKGEHRIFFTGELTSAHHHRRSFARLAREYRQAAAGCARFVWHHSESPLARKRLAQAMLLPLAAAAAGVLAVASVLGGHGRAVADAGLATLAVLTAREVLRARAVEALVYPVVGLMLGVVFTASMTASLGRMAISLRAPLAREQPAPRRVPRPGRRVPWPLVAILAAQAGMSASLIWSNTAFSDEAEYLWSGRLEIAHWLHGAPVPQMYFSGAPQIYPPVGALANAIGGLAGARILSLCFMLGASVLLYLTAARLFGKTAGYLAAALWGFSEPAIRLAFATYDPLAVFFLALATWLAVEAGHRRRRGELVAAAAVTLVLSAVTAFSVAIMAPFVIALACLCWPRSMGRRNARQAGAWLAGAAAVVFVGVMTVLHLWTYAYGTTVNRAASSLHQPAAPVVRSAWNWACVIAVLAVAGVAVACATSDRRRRLMLAVLASAVFAVPVYQAYLGTGFALDKHMAAGDWLASLAAGYAVSSLLALRPGMKAWPVVFGAAALLMPAVNGWLQAWSVYHLWPDTTRLISALSPIVARDPGQMLIEPTFVADYYLSDGRDWQQWLGGRRGLAPIRDDRMSVIVLQYSTTFPPDRLQQALFSPATASASGGLLRLALSGDPWLYSATRELQENHRYAVAAIVPFSTTNAQQSTGAYVIWTLRPAAREGISNHDRVRRPRVSRAARPPDRRLHGRAGPLRGRQRRPAALPAPQDERAALRQRLPVRGMGLLR